LFQNGTLQEHDVALERKKNTNEEADMTEVHFRGESGRAHRFAVHSPHDAFPTAAAVYGFARPGFGGKGWVVVFLSRTANLAGRMSGHERWEEARMLGATHILVHQREERDVREYVEADLLSALRPVLNGPLLEGEAVETAVASFDTQSAPSRPRLVWAA
jgi:hypothetical protein